MGFVGEVEFVASNPASPPEQGYPQLRLAGAGTGSHG